MKAETIEEFLARGGTIKKIPAGESSNTIKTTNPANQTTVGPAVLMTFGEADLFYGESRTRKPKKVKAEPKIDISALPEALRAKYTKKLSGDE